MSELIHDVGIALRFTPWRTTSRYVHWFTRDHGRIITLIRGAVRPKSFFLGQCDLFATSDLVFYRRAGAPVHLARECQLIRPRPALRLHWTATAAASSAAELLLRLLPLEAPHPRLYDVTTQWLDELGEVACAESALFWFELRVLELEGLGPKLDRCAGCGLPVPELTDAVLAPTAGGLLCGRCRAGRAVGHEAHPLPSAALHALTTWRRTRRTQLIPTVLPPAVLRPLSDALGAFLRFHLHTDLPGRELMLEMLRGATPERFAVGPCSPTITSDGRVAKLADAQDLGSCGAIRGGSSPPSPTRNEAAGVCDAIPWPPDSTTTSQEKPR